MSIIKKPKGKVKTTHTAKEPIWKGPMVDGITQSLIGKWLICRERCRILVVDGLAVNEGFRVAIEYGQMWHLAEEYHNDGKDWRKAVGEYRKKLCQLYRGQQKDVIHWYNVLMVQFPIYLEYWKNHPDEDKKPIVQEYVFRVPYKLKQSGRIVYLMGKFDGVDLINKKVYLQENKTKSDVSEQKHNTHLNFDMQVMIYSLALKLLCKEHKWGVYGGIRYNVVKRPLSGGKGSIRPHKEKRTKNTYKPAETMEQFYARLEDVILEDQDNYFKRWNVYFSASDFRDFEASFLQPVLEQICDWYLEVTGQKEGYSNYRLPYGLYNPLMDGRYNDIENYLQTGSTVGLRQVETMFPELQTD